MAKIYTVTFHRANNYGAFLQAYALQKVLLENKMDTEILDYDNKYISNIYRLFRGNETNLVRDIYHVTKNIFYFLPTKKRYEAFAKSRNNLKLSRYFKNTNEVRKNNFDNNIFIIGSDRVWNPNLTGGIDDIYTLNLNGKSIKKISYAASFGDIKNLKENEEEFKRRLSCFDGISVREKNAKDSLEKIINKKIEVVLDPSLLLDIKTWTSYCEEKRIIEDKYIFIYSIMNPSDLFVDTVNKLYDKTGYKIIFFEKKQSGNYKKIKGKLTSYYSAGPKEFVNLLKNAEYVVTSSFHGNALASIFNKKTFSILSDKPDRIITLLSKLELQKQIVKDCNDFDRAYSNIVDWNKTNNILNNERKKSVKWLINEIERVKDE